MIVLDQTLHTYTLKDVAFCLGASNSIWEFEEYAAGNLARAEARDF